MANSIGPVRVLNGRAEAAVSGRQAQGAVHTADPTDSVSLGVQCEDRASFLRESFKVRLEDRDGHADLKVTIGQKWGRGYAEVTNTDGQGRTTRVRVPLGSVSGSAVEDYFTPGGARSEIYLDNLQADHVQALEIEKDGGDGRITFYRTDGGNHGLTVGSSLTLWRA